MTLKELQPYLEAFDLKWISKFKYNNKHYKYKDIYNDSKNNDFLDYQVVSINPTVWTNPQDNKLDQRVWVQLIIKFKKPGKSNKIIKENKDIPLNKISVKDVLDFIEKNPNFVSKDHILFVYEKYPYSFRDLETHCSISSLIDILYLKQVDVEFRNIDNCRDQSTTIRPYIFIKVTWYGVEE